MTTGSQKWLPIAARLRSQLQRRIDLGLARGRSVDDLRRQAAAAISRERLPKLLETALLSTLNFTPKPRGLRR